MKKVLLLAALVALSGCEQHKLESAVKAAIPQTDAILKADSVEMKNVRKSANGLNICGDINFEAVGGRTDWTPFILTGLTGEGKKLDLYPRNPDPNLNAIQVRSYLSSCDEKPATGLDGKQY